MAKTVMIPSSDQEMWVCRINHKEYSYPQGTQQSVPDEVAELIASINAQAVTATPEEQATWEVYSQGGWIPMQGGDSLPDTSEASAGDVLSLDEDKDPVWSAPSSGGGAKVIEIDTEGTPVTIHDDPCYPVRIKGNQEYLTVNSLLPILSDIIYLEDVNTSTNQGYTITNINLYKIERVMSVSPDDTSPEYSPLIDLVCGAIDNTLTAQLYAVDMHSTLYLVYSK